MDAHANATEEALSRLRALAPLIAAAQPGMDQAGRIPAPLFDALAEAGLLRLWLPRALGGPELSPIDYMRVVEAATALDASIGWVIGNAAGASRIAGYLGEDAARRHFASPRASVVTATGAIGRAVPVAGGYRVTGRWPYGSGIHGATGVAGLCAVEGSTPPRHIFAVAPIAAARVFEGTWDVSGMRGTGSCDWGLEDVFIPDTDTFDFPAQRATQPGITYRLPVVSTFAWSVAIVPLPIARACLDAFVDLAQDRIRIGTSQALREKETVQAEVGRAEGRLRAARAFHIEAMQELIEAVDSGAADTLPQRATLRLAAAGATEAALAVAAGLEAAAGAAAIREGGPLARRLRDLRVAVQHIAMSPQCFVIAGRLRLGLDPGTSRV